LLGEDGAASRGAFLQKTDGCHVRQGLCDVDVGVLPPRVVGAEHPDRSDDVVAEPEREGVHRLVAGRYSSGREARPPGFGAPQVGVDHGLAVPDGVEARSFVDLKLEDLEPLDVLVGAGDELQVAALVGQQDSHVGVADELGGAVGDHHQELDHVELVDQGVRELHEYISEPFGRNDAHVNLPVAVSRQGRSQATSSRPSSRRSRCVTTSRATSARSRS
jgi:hypothetical protein